MSALGAIALAAALQIQPPTFSVSVESVYVDVFVTDGARVVTGLKASDFELRDDGVRRRPELVGIDQAPLTTVLVLDTSESVSGQELARLQAAAQTVLQRLGPGEKAALLTFGGGIEVRVPPTSDHLLLGRGIRGILAGGGTPLYDALYSAVSLASDWGRSLFVVFTDGQDNLSRLDARQLERVVEASNALVQAIGIVPELPAPTPAPPPPELSSHEAGYSPLRPFYVSPEDLGESEPAHVRTLRRLAESTGGRFWPVPAADALGPAFLAVFEAMRTRYVLRFEPDGASRPGSHRLELKLAQRRGKVHCRRAYFVGPPGR